jgi:hypothetical protein
VCPLLSGVFAALAALITTSGTYVCVYVERSARASHGHGLGTCINLSGHAQRPHSRLVLVGVQPQRSRNPAMCIAASGPSTDCFMGVWEYCSSRRNMQVDGWAPGVNGMMATSLRDMTWHPVCRFSQLVRG